MVKLIGMFLCYLLCRDSPHSHKHSAGWIRGNNANIKPTIIAHIISLSFLHRLLSLSRAQNWCHRASREIMPEYSYTYINFRIGCCHPINMYKISRDFIRFFGRSRAHTQPHIHTYTRTCQPSGQYRVYGIGASTQIPDSDSWCVRLNLWSIKGQSQAAFSLLPTPNRSPPSHRRRRRLHLERSSDQVIVPDDNGLLCRNSMHIIMARQTVSTRKYQTDRQKHLQIVAVSIDRSRSRSLCKNMFRVTQEFASNTHTYTHILAASQRTARI